MRRRSAWTKPIPPVGTPEHRALVEHSLDVYGSDLGRRFALTQAEWADTVKGLLGHCERYGIEPPPWLASYAETQGAAAKE